MIVKLEKAGNRIYYGGILSLTLENLPKKLSDFTDIKATAYNR